MVNMPYASERKQADRLLADMRIAAELLDGRANISRFELGELINLVDRFVQDFQEFDSHNCEGYALPTAWTIRGNG